MFEFLSEWSHFIIFPGWWDMKAKEAFFLFLGKSMYFLSIITKCFGMIKIIYVFYIYVYICQFQPAFLNVFFSDIF